MDDYKFRMVEMMHLYLSGMITDEEMLELQRWMDVAPENRAMFDRICEGKDILYKYRMYKKIDHRVAYEHCEIRGGIKRRSIREWLKYAAMLLLPLGAIFVMLRNNERKQPVEVATVDILPGETKATLILADGKSVVLQHDTTRDIAVGEGVNAKNSGSGIVYSANGNEKRNLQYNV